jgi:arginine decarboxylase
MRKAIITKGFGTHHMEYHAGAYHMALYEAGISQYNIIPYTSVLSKDVSIVSTDEVDMPEFGSTMYVIQSAAKGQFGEYISAGIVYAWLYNDENFNDKSGGLVCEISGHYDFETIQERLLLTINDLYEQTFQKEGMFIGEPEVIVECGSIPNDSRYGCALVSICFID